MHEKYELTKGTGSIYLGALTFVTVYTTAKERAGYQALIGICYAVGLIVGPVVGGGFASSSATWRWAFYINLCIAAVTAPILLFIFPSFCPRPNVPVWTKIREMDWLGIVLIAAVYTTFILAFSFGGVQWKWNNGREIAMLVVFGILLLSLIAQQKFRFFTTPELQIFPVSFIKRRTFVLTYITSATVGSALFIGIYYVPLYFQFVHGDSGIKAASRLVSPSLH